ncbi:MAG: GNAT family N-acetyltransferase [Ginsengibacter sp.]
MILREAGIGDIDQIQIVRHAVKENVLSDPALVTNEDCIEYLTKRGKGWVCEIDNLIAGFAIVDLKDQNIWALFVHTDFEKNGFGTMLHNTMLTWYFSKSKDKVWLSTSPRTRAEIFYRRQGWQENGTYGKGEIKFEMTFENWQKIKLNHGHQS